MQEKEPINQHSPKHLAARTKITLGDNNLFGDREGAEIDACGGGPEGGSEWLSGKV